MNGNDNFLPVKCYFEAIGPRCPLKGGFRAEADGWSRPLLVEGWMVIVMKPSSQVESRWKGTSVSNLQRIKDGHQPGVIGAPQLADLFDPALLRGWHDPRAKGVVERMI